ncbi:MAG: hypothetical protein ACTS9Y_00645 [Methylophilus sp.]|uniref:hypothetical protein n=1 Tax=Methylophilus sp. TaxID=29541 RepID=UPI003FA10E7C
MHLDFDINWQAYFKSHGDFILAQLKGKDAAYQAALDVQCMLPSGLTYTVDSIMLSCAKHHTSQAEYKAWMEVTRIRLDGQLKLLTGIAREALIFVINEEQSEESLQEQAESRENALNAIEEIKHRVYAGMEE